MLAKNRWAHPNLNGILEEMRANDELSLEDFNKVKKSLLGKTLQRAIECPFYKKMFHQYSVDPEDVATLVRFPPLFRSMTQEFRDEMVHPDADQRELALKTTSGSTGTKASFYRSRAGIEWGYATGERCKETWNLDRSARYVRVWGRSFKYQNRLLDRLGGYARLAKDLAVGVLNVDASGLSQESIEALWPKIMRWRPARIHGYAAGIYLIAKLVNEAGLSGRDLNLDSAILESEQCFQFQKEEIHKAFGCPVLEWYGCVETGVIATPCRKGRLHIREDHVYVEVVDGKILLTTLREKGMPLVRYQVGDEGAISNQLCECGLPSRTFSELHGRIPDQLRRMDGSYFPGHMLTHVFDRFPSLRRFQLTQVDEDLVRVLVEVGRPMKPDDCQELEVKLQRMFGGPIRVELQECFQIPSQKSGKFRWVRNEIHSSGGERG